VLREGRAGGRGVVVRQLIRHRGGTSAGTPRGWTALTTGGSGVQNLEGAARTPPNPNAAVAGALWRAPGPVLKEGRAGGRGVVVRQLIRHRGGTPAGTPRGWTALTAGGSGVQNLQGAARTPPNPNAALAGALLRAPGPVLKEGRAGGRGL